MNINETIKKIKAQKAKKFDESIDVVFAITTPKSTESNIRLELSLPHQFGEKKKVLVLCEKNEIDSAKGADFVGLEEYVEKIKNGWKEFDVVIASPTVMPKIAILGKYLGASGLMPNPKNGTITKDLAKAVNEFKSGKLNAKSNKGGQLYLTVGKKSMEAEIIEENISYVIKALQENIGTSTNIKSAFVKSSMGIPYRLM
jgi:large subunit ribosomal protein L1